MCPMYIPLGPPWRLQPTCFAAGVTDPAITRVVAGCCSFRLSTHMQYIVLEYMENGALSGVIKSSSFGPFPETLVAVYVQQVLQASARQ